MLSWLFTPHNRYAVSAKARSGRATMRGQMQVEDGELVLDGRRGRLALPLEGIQVTRNRWLGGALQFTHPKPSNLNGQRWTIFTRDERILRDPQFTDGKNIERRLRVRFYWTRRMLRWGCLAFLLTMIFVPSARRCVSGHAVMLIPAATDVYLGDQYYYALKRDRGVVDDAEAPELREIALLLSQSLPPSDRRFTIHVHLAADSSVNAFALPGGHIVVNSGLILEAHNAEELAGVIGHEMGHVTHRHTMRHIVEIAGVYALIRGIAGDTRGWENMAGIGAALTRLSFSRDDEREADVAGWTRLRQAHLRSTSLQEFFVHMNQGADTAPPELRMALQMLSTHPMTRERIMELQDLSRSAPEDAAIAPLEIDFAGFQNRVRKLQESSARSVRAER